ncbi:MAG TPA: TldD/PmbA family protein [Lentisphaeria bacterium]|nr:TldD/PmbA family protein [Lentisphaeria bacterium]
MKQRLMDALKNARADYAEIRYEQSDATSFSYRGPEQENASTGRTTGGIVRACHRGGWGVCSFDTLDDLEEKVADACSAAALVGREKTVLAEGVPVVDQEFRAPLQQDFRTVPIQDKVALVERYNEIVRKSTPGVETSLVSYSDTFRTVYFASTRGSYFLDERPRVILVLSAGARSGGLVQRAHESVASATDYGIVFGREELAREVAQRAVDLLKAPQCPGGRYTVVLRPDLTGVFAHEAFGHLSEADFLYENQQMRELMTIGRVMGVKNLNITDDGARGTLQGTHPVDDEGVPTQRTELIKNGVLVGHLHSLETAGKMGARPTGNARAISGGYAPIVRMTNTFIEPGDLTREQLFADIDDGIYACGMKGGQTMMEMFTFSAAYGYRIRNGQVCELLRDVVLTGNVFDTLHAIDGIADDFTINETGGGCGKGGQSPLPVTEGGPHIRIRNAVIGGR